MRFIMIEDYPIENIKFLQGDYRVVSGPMDEEIIYEVDEKWREEVKVLERAGLLKEIKSGIRSIEKVVDIIPLTERVEILQGGSVYLRVQAAQHVFFFTENELLTSLALRKQLLRLKKVIQVSMKDWDEILQYWLNIGEEIVELSPEEEIVEKALNYLSECRIFKEKELAVTPFSLYYIEETPDRVYCCIDELVERIGYENRRKLRTLLSDYILVNSLQFMIHHQRRRFWAFSIQRCGIDLKRQRYEKEEVEEIDEAGEICGEDNRTSGDWEND